MRTLLILAGTAAAGYALWLALRQQGSASTSTSSTSSAPLSDWSGSFYAPADDGVFSSIFDSAASAATDVSDYVTALVKGPRGIRNNNPGNIRIGNDWQGERAQPTDPEFEEFVSPTYGIRALAKVLRKYQTQYGLSTVRGIITRWAPPAENNTGSYISSVASKLGVSADTTLDLYTGTLLRRLIAAIIQHENGQQPYSDAQIDAGIALA